MWTKNYKNMVRTAVTNGLSGGTSSSATSEYPYDDTCFFNFKAPDGKVYTIRNYTEKGLDGLSLPFIGVSSGANNKSFLKLLTNPTTNYTSSVLPSELYVGLGSDNTPTTELDYALGNHISTIKGVASSATGTVVLNNNGTMTASYTFVVQATADTTVNELGLFKPVPYYISTGSSPTRYSKYVLINRIVLDEPISIATDQTATIKFSLTTPEINFS